MIRGVARKLCDAVKDLDRRRIALAEYRVAPIEDMHRVQRKEQFAVIGVGATVAEGEPAGPIVGKAGGIFILEAEANIGITADVACNVPELDIEIRKHAVDRHTVVKPVMKLNEFGSGSVQSFVPSTRERNVGRSAIGLSREEPTGDVAHSG